MIEVRKKPILLAVKNGKPVEHLVLNGKEIIHSTIGTIAIPGTTTSTTLTTDAQGNPLQFPIYIKPILQLGEGNIGITSYTVNRGNDRFKDPFIEFKLNNSTGNNFNGYAIKGTHLVTDFQVEFPVQRDTWSSAAYLIFWGNWFYIQPLEGNFAQISRESYSDDGSSWRSTGPWVEASFGTPDKAMFAGGIKYENGKWYKYLEIWGEEVWKNEFLFRERQVSSSNWYGGALPVTLDSTTTYLPIINNYVNYSNAYYRINYKTGELTGANSAAGGSGSSYGYYPNWTPTFYGYVFTQNGRAILTDISDNRAKSDWNVLKFQQMPWNNDFTQKSYQFGFLVTRGTTSDSNVLLHLKVIDMGEENN